MVAGPARRRVVHLLPDVLLSGVGGHVGGVVKNNSMPRGEEDALVDFRFGARSTRWLGWRPLAKAGSHGRALSIARLNPGLGELLAALPHPIANFNASSPPSLLRASPSFSTPPHRR